MTQRFSRDQVETISIDLALTISVHSKALGLKPDTKAEIRMPHGFQLAVRTVSNVYELADGRPSKFRPKNFLGGTTEQIPAMPFDLRLSSPRDRSIRAVIVTEHRSINGWLDKFDGMEENGLHSLILIMVSLPLLHCST